MNDDDSEAAAAMRSVRRAARQEQLQAAGLELLGPCERLSQRTDLLQQSPLLQDFTPAEADILGAAMLRVRAQPGQLLIAEDDASDWMMLLLPAPSTWASARSAPRSTGDEPGDITRLAVLKDGAVIGEMSMLDGEPRYASCWALERGRGGGADPRRPSRG